MQPVVSRGEVLSALSYALDLAEGQTAGHVARTCLIALRAADELRYGPGQRRIIFEAALLKDAGCSASSARVAAALGADDRRAKAELKLVDWTQRRERVRYAARLVLPDAPLRQRARRLAVLAVHPELQREFVQARCERGAQIARELGFPDEVAAAVLALDEHWDGHGQPHQLAGPDIPPVSRLLCAAQSLEVFATRHGLARAWTMLRLRRGRWFEPAVVDALEATAADAPFWDALLAGELEGHLPELAPAPEAQAADEAWLDRIAAGFAAVIDAKSPYTAVHSRRVAAIATEIAMELGLPADERRELHRAGLLHDIGKLGLSNRILDKPGALTVSELAQVRVHPRHTADILCRVRRFEGLARDAAAHHERLDGSGYPDGLRAGRLSSPARILAVADVYEALTSDRPYRPALSVEQAVGELRRDAGPRLDRAATEALVATLASQAAA